MERERRRYAKSRTISVRCCEETLPLHKSRRLAMDVQSASGPACTNRKVPKRCCCHSSTLVLCPLRRLHRVPSWTVMSFRPCRRHHRQRIPLAFARASQSRHVDASSRITAATGRSIEHRRFHPTRRHSTRSRRARWMRDSAKLIVATARCPCRHHAVQAEHFRLIYRRVHHRGGA